MLIFVKLNEVVNAVWLFRWNRFSISPIAANFSSTRRMNKTIIRYQNAFSWTRGNGCATLRDSNAAMPANCHSSSKLLKRVTPQETNEAFNYETNNNSDEFRSRFTFKNFKPILVNNSSYKHEFSKCKADEAALRGLRRRSISLIQYRNPTVIARSPSDCIDHRLYMPGQVSN